MEEPSVWYGDVPLEAFEEQARDCLISHLGIEVIAKEPRTLRGRMPVDQRTVQPAGLLHGGASVAFAETLASWAGYLTVDRSRFHVVGQEINANHVRSVASGSWVYGAATPLSLGRRTQVWDIRITDEQDRLVCVSRCTVAVLEMASTYAGPGERGSA